MWHHMSGNYFNFSDKYDCWSDSGTVAIWNILRNSSFSSILCIYQLYVYIYIYQIVEGFLFAVTIANWINYCHFTFLIGTATARGRDLDLSEFLDDQPETCTTVAFYDAYLQSAPVVVTTDSFKSLQLRLWMRNLSAEPGTNCDLPVLVTTRASELEPGQGSCKPFCNALVKCDLESKPEVVSPLNVSNYICHCQVDRCKGVIIMSRSRRFWFQDMVPNYNMLIPPCCNGYYH